MELLLVVAMILLEVVLHAVAGAGGEGTRSPRGPLRAFELALGTVQRGADPANLHVTGVRGARRVFRVDYATRSVWPRLRVSLECGWRGERLVLRWRRQADGSSRYVVPPGGRERLAPVARELERLLPFAPEELQLGRGDLVFLRDPAAPELTAGEAGQLLDALAALSARLSLAGLVRAAGPRRGAAVRVRIASRVGPLRCPYCHDEVAPAVRRACSGCRTAHHEACYAEAGGCSVHGCDASPRWRRVRA